jgi:serine protease Do
MDGKKIRNASQLRNVVAATAPGTAVKLKIWRDGEERTLAVTLGELPADDKAPPIKQSLQELLGFSAAMSRDLAAQYHLDANKSDTLLLQVMRRTGSFYVAFEL